MQKQGWVYTGTENNKAQWKYDPDLAHEKEYQSNRWVHFR